LIKPTHYRIRLDPDLKNFLFAGTTEILFETERSVCEICLHAAELAFWNCKVELEGGGVDCPFSVGPREEELKIHLPREMAGEIRVSIDFTGRISSKMAGFYRSRYVQEGRERTMAVTQFQESDARRAFPCLDRPRDKATFDVEMVVDEGVAALSNMPVAKEETLHGGRRLVHFARTPKMSTYLLFFGVGDFEFITDEEDPRVRGATPPGMSKFARKGLGLGRKSLHFCETYYGIDYPLPKLDLIAVADFAFGAMENWGAITFRENLLLHFADITSKAGEQRIFEVIAHEIAHQWFGNLVTPSDWKYLWLNESFATLFGNRVVSHYHPEWEVWAQFLHADTNRALDRDAMRNTVPIEMPGGEQIAINEVTAPIIYDKGASILRQVEGYIGEEAVREGLRRYLKKHAYDCASSHHLWESLEEAAERPVTRMMKGWIEQPGYPVVEARRENGRLHLTQRRFTYLEDVPSPEWMIPIHVRVFNERGDSREVTTLLESPAGELDLGPDAVAYKLNAGQTGFYRVHYRDRDNLEHLGRKVSDRVLSAEDRWGIQNDLFAFAKSGTIAAEDYLAFLSHYREEDAFLPLAGIAANLFLTYLIMEGDGRDKAAGLGRELTRKLLTRIGFEPDAGESHTTSMLRDQIILPAVIFGLDSAADFAARRFDALSRGEPVHPDIMKSIMQAGAWMDCKGAFGWFKQRLATAESEHERMNILAALGSFRAEGTLEEARRYVLDEVPDRNKFVTICHMALNPSAVPHMWEWCLAHLEALEQLHPIHFERIVAGIVPVCGMGRQQEVEAFFSDYMERKKIAKDTIRMALEKLAVYSRMRGSTAGS
jgi:tricorn protease interacting factor F2/3